MTSTMDTVGAQAAVNEFMSPLLKSLAHFLTVAVTSDLSDAAAGPAVRIGTIEAATKASARSVFMADPPDVYFGTVLPYLAARNEHCRLDFASPTPGRP